MKRIPTPLFFFALAPLLYCALAPLLFCAMSMAVHAAVFWIQPSRLNPLPIVESATIGTNGETFTIVHSEVVDIGGGGNGGFVPTLTGGAATLAYTSGSGSTSLVYTLSRVVVSTETGTLAYTQPGNGVEDSADADMLTFSGFTIDNQSSQTSGPTLIANDNFNSYGGGLLHTESADWTNLAGDIDTDSGGVRPFTASGGLAVYYWNADAFDPDHMSEITLAAVSANTRSSGAAVRVQSGATTFYCVYWGSNTTGTTHEGLHLMRVNGGTMTEIAADTSIAGVAGYKLRLAAEGVGSATRLTVYTDTGSGWTAHGSMTNIDPGGTYIDDGAAGIFFRFSSGTLTIRIDDWVGYNL